MANKAPFKTTFEVTEVIRPIFTGGAVALDNGAQILATTLGEDVVLTNPATGKHIAQIEGDGEGISTLTLTPSGSHLVVCSRSLSMRIYALKSPQSKDTITPQLLRTVKPHGTPVIVLAVDRTGTLLATGGTDGSIKVWDIVGGYVTHTFRGPSVLVSALHFFEVAAGSVKGHDVDAKKDDKKKRRKSKTADDEPEEDLTATARFRLASGSQDGKVRVWDLHKRSVVANLESHVSDVRGLDYSPDQNTLVTTGRDKTITWWDSKSWKVRKVVPCFEEVEAVGFTGDGRLTYTAGSAGWVSVWDTETGKRLTKQQEPKSNEESIIGAVSRPELPFIICVQLDHTLALYHHPIQKSSSEAPIAFRRISGTHDQIIDLRYLLPDSSMLALATNSEDIRLISVTKPSDGASGLVSSNYFGQDIALLKGHDQIIISLDVDWSGHWVATGATDNTARLWRIDPANNSYTCYTTFSGHAESIGAVALPRARPVEGSKAFTDPLSHPPPFLITGSKDQTIKRWEIPRMSQDSNKSLRSAFTRKAHDKDINAIDVNYSSQMFASASQDRTVKIWSVEEGEVQGILRGHRRGVWSVSFAPSNTPVIQGEQGPVAGKGVVITGSGDKTIKLWSLSDYSCLRTFEGHTDNVLKVAWLKIPASEDRNKKPVLFSSAGGDGLVKVWDVNRDEPECTLDNHEDRVWALTVHPETNMIVSGSGDSTVTFWKDTSSETQAASNEAQEMLIQQEQELENHVRTGSYREAITLALQLNHPGRLLSLFTKVVSSNTPDEGSLSGLKAVDQVLANLSDEQLFLLLLRLRDWNTNARTAPMAQRILWALVRSYPASRISNLSVKGARGQKSLKEVLNGLKVYTERHYKRMEELVDESYLVEYTLQEMESLAPPLAEISLDSIDGDIVMAS
ncbi:WD40-repeat-containing domain protein [Pseudomassariella vexata]|uniref:WD40-repeat-containing domain protein n=1 Tax=Pseudomassariella vexata TaxID=1141098 RepID=A0A1Y2EIV7_9PEZI|nr:WD40-repeat-containing domain protein [Pseudomassariella vexata]ORY71254.1 WD40-repeat-containing domain protein [Pseudomassariella vexata]